MNTFRDPVTFLGKVKPLGYSNIFYLYAIFIIMLSLPKRAFKISSTKL